MTPLQAVVLGAIQGVTEFLPVSSSGHVLLVEKLWHIQGNNLLFITLLHLGTLAAVLWALKDDVRWLILHPFSWTAKMLVVALVPTFIVGSVFEEIFEHMFQTGVTLGFEFVITGIILWWMDEMPRGAKREDNIGIKDAAWIGFWQGVAIMPALSRSGLTIAAGIWRGMDREAAGRFSFLLSIPAILGAAAVTLDDALESNSFAHPQWGVLAAGMIAALLAGYGSVKGTLYLLRRSKMRPFAYYVFALAAFVFFDQLFLHRWFPPLLR